MTPRIDRVVDGDLEPLLAVVIAALEHDLDSTGAPSGDLASTLAATLAARGVPTQLDAPLRAGGRAELLLAVPHQAPQAGSQTPATVPAWLAGSPTRSAASPLESITWSPATPLPPTTCSTYHFRR